MTNSIILTLLKSYHNGPCPKNDNHYSCPSGVPSYRCTFGPCDGAHPLYECGQQHPKKYLPIEAIDSLSLRKYNLNIQIELQTLTYFVGKIMATCLESSCNPTSYFDMVRGPLKTSRLILESISNISRYTWPRHPLKTLPKIRK